MITPKILNELMRRSQRLSDIENSIAAACTDEDWQAIKRDWMNKRMATSEPPPLPLTESTRDALIHDLGTAAFEDDIVWNHLRTSVGRCSEREVLVAVVKHLVAERRELKLQCVELAAKFSGAVR